jgi:hypothetical protein
MAYDEKRRQHSSAVAENELDRTKAFQIAGTNSLGSCDVIVR